MRSDIVSEYTLVTDSSRTRAFNMKQIKENIFSYRREISGRIPIAPQKSCARIDGLPI